MALPIAQKIPPRTESSFICQGRDIIYHSRGATLLHGIMPCSYQDTIISLAADGCHPSQNTRNLCRSFPCALRGPFNSLRSVRFSASRSLCKCTVCFYLRIYGFQVTIYFLLSYTHFRFLSTLFCIKVITCCSAGYCLHPLLQGTADIYSELELVSLGDGTYQAGSSLYRLAVLVLLRMIL